MVSELAKKVLAAMARGACPDICSALIDNGQSWEQHSEVYYRLAKQMHLPWATYSKWINYLVDQGFVERTETVHYRRKVVMMRVTDLGKTLVQMHRAVLQALP